MKKLRVPALAASSLFLLISGYGTAFAQSGSAQPECVNITVYGDPSTRMAFAWITDAATTDGTIQIVARENASEADFTADGILKSVTVTTEVTDEVNYSRDKNGIAAASGLKIKFCSHKALATGLTPDTKYSFRVGKDGAWSKIGHFKTTKADNSDFTFIYVADTQSTTAADFAISAQTMATAVNKVGADDISFFLHTGDYVDGYCQSEWEYRQFFSSMEDTWLNHAMVAIPGNHDYYNYYSDNSLPRTSQLFDYHFNTDINDTTPQKHNYSFRQGSVLFLVLDYEFAWGDDLRKTGDWMRQVVADDAASENPARWRIACHHRGLFTGGPHQGGWNGSWDAASEGRDIREIMFPIYRELDIDLALQGHDHVYEVIGPVRDGMTTSSVYNELVTSANISKENQTGKRGGLYNVQEGTLFFLNGAAGTKGYHAHDKAGMDSHIDAHGVENYWGLFSGALGRPGYTVSRYAGLPTFSRVNVTDEYIEIITYMVENGSTKRFDTVRVIKEPFHTAFMTVNGDPSTSMGFSWLGHRWVYDGKFQILEGHASETDFESGDPRVISASVTKTPEMNYKIAANQLWGWGDDLKIHYRYHQAVADRLKPGTEYSYRVGFDGFGYGEVGYFRTAPSADEPFDFLFLTDTQASTKPSFDVAGSNFRAALATAPDAAFILHTGDLANGYCQSEWEYEQFYRISKEANRNIPLAITPGNHDYNDAGDCANFRTHFNTDKTFTYTGMPYQAEGATYSFRRGNALFLVLGFEHYTDDDYMRALKEWMRHTVDSDNHSATPAKWRIAAFHRPLFTGGRHQGTDNGSWTGGADGKALRAHMRETFDQCGIDISIQGHDHIYEIIGPLNNTLMTMVPGAAPGDASTYTRGTGSGSFSLANGGTLYFSNGSGSDNSARAKTFAEMEADFSLHGVPDYPSLFAAAPIQTNRPMFSKIHVGETTVTFSTYAVEADGTPTPFDTFIVTKPGDTSGIRTTGALETDVIHDPVREVIIIEGALPDDISVYTTTGIPVTRGRDIEISTAGWLPGLYIVKVTEGHTITTRTIIVR